MPADPRLLDATYEVSFFTVSICIAGLMHDSFGISKEVFATV